MTDSTPTPLRRSPLDRAERRLRRAAPELRLPRLGPLFERTAFALFQPVPGAPGGKRRRRQRRDAERRAAAETTAIFETAFPNPDEAIYLLGWDRPSGDERSLERLAAVIDGPVETRELVMEDGLVATWLGADLRRGDLDHRALFDGIAAAEHRRRGPGIEAAVLVAAAERDLYFWRHDYLADVFAEDAAGLVEVYERFAHLRDHATVPKMTEWFGDR